MEDILLANAERVRQKLEHAQHKRQQEETPQRPQISSPSANLARDGDVAERLYSLAQQKSTTSSSMETGRSRSAPRDRDPDTGQRLFSPAINPRSAQIVRARPIEEVLQEKGAEQARRQQEIAREAEEEARKKAAEPKVGPYSAVLVDFLERRTQTKTHDRLHEPIHKLRPQTAQVIVDERRHQYPFKPSINPISEQIDRTVNGPADGSARLGLLMRKQEHYEQKKSRMQAEVRQFDTLLCAVYLTVTFLSSPSCFVRFFRYWRRTSKNAPSRPAASRRAHDRAHSRVSDPVRLPIATPNGCVSANSDWSWTVAHERSRNWKRFVGFRIG